MIEPREGWGERAGWSRSKLPTNDDIHNDNIVVGWAPNGSLMSQVAGLRLPHHRDDDGSEPDAGRPHVIATYLRLPRSVGSGSDPRRWSGLGDAILIDFPAATCRTTGHSLVETVATASAGRILRTFLTPNTHIRGFRAGVDVAVDPGQHRPAGSFSCAPARGR